MSENMWLSLTGSEQLRAYHLERWRKGERWDYIARRCLTGQISVCNTVECSAWRPLDAEHGYCGGLEYYQGCAMAAAVHPARFNDMIPEEQERLFDWIVENLKPIRGINRRRSAYGLKHIAGRALGFYIVEGAFRGGMLKAGFRYISPWDYPHVWRFNVSERSPALVRKRNLWR